MNRKKKRIATGAAVALAAVLAVTGTLAWQSYNQVARNGKEVIFNPGGRLHRDYDGAGSRKIYVENFTDPNNGGVKIYARVRLDEYMEFGEDAGTAADTENREATPVLDGAKYEDVSTWRTRTPGTDDGISQRRSWNVSGDKTVYLPTFNKDNYSLAADINGTYEKDGESGERYGDYRSYSLKQEVDGTEDRGKDRDGNAVTRDTVHIAAETPTATYMTMEEWLGKDEDEKVGPYWVWDEDGWFYWAEPIAPGEATGVLNVRASENPDSPHQDTWGYYSINAVGQCVTAGDTGVGKGTGFYDPQEGTAPTENAARLLDVIGADYYADRIRAIDITNNPGSTEMVTIDGIDWYVLYEDKEENKALLLSKVSIIDRPFDKAFGSAAWGTISSTSLRTYLNGEWLDSKPTIKSLAKATTLYTIDKYNSTTFEQTEDTVFLLSEADVYGTSGGNKVTDSKYYTAGEQLTAPGGEWGAYYGTTTDKYAWWLRSRRRSSKEEVGVAAVDVDGNATQGEIYMSSIKGRPAFWFDLSK